MRSQEVCSAGFSSFSRYLVSVVICYPPNHSSSRGPKYAQNNGKRHARSKMVEARRAQDLDRARRRLLFAEPARAAAPPPASVTLALIEAARKEGKLSYYSALEL